MSAELHQHDTQPSNGCVHPACPALVGQHGKFSTWDGEICVCVVLAENVDLPWDSDMLHVRYVKANGTEQYGYIPRDRFKPNASLSHGDESATPQAR